jgi:hypothetical protein
VSPACLSRSSRAIDYFLLDGPIIALVLRRKVVIRFTLFDELPSGGAMLLDERRLEERTFIRVKSKPVHAFENSLDHCFGRALNVGVFDAKDEHAFVLAGEKPVEKSSARPAEVKIACGRRRKAYSNGLSHNVRLSATDEKKGKLT